MAVAQTIVEFYVKSNLRFDIIIYGNVSRFISDLVDETLKRINGTFVVTIAHQTQILEINKPSWILFANVEMFNKHILETKVTSSSQQDMRILVYIADIAKKGRSSKFLNPSNLLSSGHQSAVLYEHHIIPNEVFVTLMRIEWFWPELCNIKSYIIVNRFIIDNSSWMYEWKLPKKFRDFFGCILRVKPHETQSIFYYRTFYPNEEDQPAGVIADVAKILGQQGNFTATFEKSSFYHFTLVPMMYGMLTYNDSVDYQITSPFVSVEHKFMITPSDAYNAYEKLLLPFDGFTWLLTLLTFFAAYAVTLLLRFRLRQVQSVVYGENVTTPGLNITMIFYGYGQTRLPTRTFARLILMLFIFFCLIIRTAYQGITFDFLTSDKLKPSPATFEELIEQNFTVKVEDDPIFLKQIQSAAGGCSVNIMTFNSVHAFKEDFIENIDMHEAKSAYLMTPNVFLELTKNYNKTGVYLKEHFDVFSMPYGFAVPQGSFFVDLLDNTMQWLVTAGIPQHLMEFHRWMFMRPVDDEESGPVVLTVEILSHGFVLWLVSLGVSTVVFVYEISMYELKRWVFKSLGNLMVLEHVMLVLEKHIF